MMEQQQQEQGDANAAADLMTTRVLPEDVLAQILCRLAPRDLAASRCVCGEWKGAIDGRRLLRADLLPLSVGGIFLLTSGRTETPSTFFRPERSTVSGSVIHLYPCNGLILLHSCVAIPATGWFAALPPWPRPRQFFHQSAYLVFDPTVSSHYSVFIVNYAPLYDGEESPPAAEWPPSP
jgi:hypothetical protein